MAYCPNGNLVAVENILDGTIQYNVEEKEALAMPETHKILCNECGQDPCQCPCGFCGKDDYTCWDNYCPICDNGPCLCCSDCKRPSWACVCDGAVCPICEGDGPCGEICLDIIAGDNIIRNITISFPNRRVVPCGTAIDEDKMEFISNPHPWREGEVIGVWFYKQHIY